MGLPPLFIVTAACPFAKLVICLHYHHLLVMGSDDLLYPHASYESFNILKFSSLPFSFSMNLEC